MFLVAMGLIGFAPESLQAAALVSPSPAWALAAAKPVFSQDGLASRYGGGRMAKTADGEAFNPQALTGAHRSLPFNTVVRVTDVKSGKTAKVRINDRGPFRKRRIIDLSAAAADALGMVKNRIDRVKLEVFAGDPSEALGSDCGSARQGARLKSGCRVRASLAKRRQVSNRVMDGPHEAGHDD